MDNFESNYYPPRARCYGPLLLWRDRLWQSLAQPWMALSPGVTWPGLIGSFLVPGLGFYLCGRRFWGKIALGVCSVLLLLFIIFLGYPSATFFFGALLSIHASSLITYCAPLVAGEEWHLRLGASFALYLAAIFLLYVPARGLVEKHLLIPLRFHGQVIVAQRLFSPGTVAPGNWIAYHLSRNAQEVGNDQMVHITGGMGFGAVLAIPGDEVDFGPGAFSVHGVTQPRRDHMPKSGQVIVPENCWFIWPDFAISGHGNIPEANISETMLRAAMVGKSQFMGKAFRRWFWRRQLPL